MTLVETPKLLLIAEAGTPAVVGSKAVLIGRLLSARGELIQTAEQLDAMVPDVMVTPALSGPFGNYLLIRWSEIAASIYRDPSGGVAAYRIGTGEERIYFSDAALAGTLQLRLAGVDQRFIIHWLQFPFLRTARTGLDGVCELLPGVEERVDAQGAWTEIVRWRPAQWTAARHAMFDADVAAAELRACALRTIPALVQTETPALQLSGGLDSSIVAACLADSGRIADCITFATRSAEGDERHYAAAVAAMFAFPLEALVEEQSTCLPQAVRTSFRPGANPLLAPLEQAVDQALSTSRATVLVDGAGGDNVFCHLTSAAPVIDAWHLRGMAEALSAARAIGSRVNADWWQVTRAVARQLIRRRRWKEDRSFLNRDALLTKPDTHPWLSGLADALPGKREHVQAIVHIQHFLDRRSSPLPLCHPLLAQPMLECCLKIPSWLWMTGGRDRAIARLAFAGRLPDAVLRRRTKGSLQGLFHRGLHRLFPQIRDMLLTGHLRAAAIIDFAALEAQLRDVETIDEVAQLRISELAALELWLRAWTT